MSMRTICQARWAGEGDETEREHDARPGEHAGDSDQRHGEAVEQRQHRLGARPEQQRGRLDADQRVVLAILMRVDGVVADHPGDRAGIEHERRGIEPAEHGGPAHQRAPGEGEAEHDLRPIGDALHEGVDRDDDERGDPGGDGEAVELQQHEEPDQRLRHQERRRPGDAHLAGRDRTGARALDAAVEIAVDDVVPGAAGAAHREGADEEQQEMPQARQRLDAPRWRRGRPTTSRE